MVDSVDDPAVPGRIHQFNGEVGTGAGRGRHQVHARNRLGGLRRAKGRLTRVGTMRHFAVRRLRQTPEFEAAIEVVEAQNANK